MEPDHLSAWDVAGFIEGELEPAGLGVGAPRLVRGVCALAGDGAGG